MKRIATVMGVVLAASIVLVANAAINPPTGGEILLSPDFNCQKLPDHWKCQLPTPTPSVAPTPTPVATPTPTIAPTPTPTIAPTPTPTVAPTPTPTPTIAPTPTPTIAPTPVPTATPTLPPPTTGDYIIISRARLMSLPTSGTGWSNVLSWASKSASSPSLSDQDDPDNITVLAKALVYARTGDTTRRNEVLSALAAVRGTESGARALAVGREAAAYVIAADLIGYRDASFVSWVSSLRTAPTTSGPSNIIDCQQSRPNNWGTHCGATRVVIDLYIKDTTDLAKAINVWKGWMGDRTAYTGFSFGDLSWQSNPSAPVGINPKGATIQSHNVDGVLPDDQRRGGSFTWPPFCENYVHEALQGTNLALAVLSTNGYPMGSWSDNAINRAYNWLYDVDSCPATGDDTFSPYIVNYFTGSSIPETSSTPGKNFGFSEWLYN